MKLQKQGMATLGLIFITFLAAIQYVFLQNVPDSVSTFAFVCITNIIGLIVLGIFRFNIIRSIHIDTLKKGILFALELTGFNFFTLLGSKNMDAVIISSVVSLYFVFVTPLLLLLKKRVNFFSGIASVIAIIALLLMFGADTEELFSSINVIYLILADIFFATYVVSVSILGDNEDSSQLSFSQMLFSAVFALIGWILESMTGHGSLSLPKAPGFWISALFIGIFIRAVYGLVQLACQKHVSALKASLIFASEIIITLVTNPFLCNLFGLEYTPATIFQVVGGFLFIIATLMIDDGIMAKFGYEDLEEVMELNEAGETVQRSSVAKKMIFTTLTFSLLTLILSTVVFLSAIHFIRNSAVDNSQELGENASQTSSDAMRAQLEENISNQAKDKTLLAEEKLEAYSDSMLFAASYAHSLYEDRENYPNKEVQRPLKKNAGKWVMQRTLANTSISYAQLKDESRLLGNMLDAFEPIVDNNDNIATVYMGTEDGLLISYDIYSDSGAEEGESYYEYRNSEWYRLGKETAAYAFSSPYQDSYGRGLTITCVAPFFDAQGQFAGCIAMDILMKELNNSMVNDGIVNPSVATLIDGEGKYIAGMDVNPTSENMGSIFDEGKNPVLQMLGEEILDKKNGIISSGDDDDATYIAFSTIDTVDWTLCILSPVSAVIQPAIEIRESIDENTDNVVTTVVQGILNAIQSCLVLSALILIFVTLFTGRMSKRISDPLKKLEADVKEISAGNLQQRTSVHTNDEIGSLASSFNQMTDSLQKYIDDLQTATAEKERIGAELELATKIQADMLPNEFPAFPDREDFDIFASMTPAKEVGGDFYDFFLIDGDHMGLVIADVSGKGVPAALFMMMSKILINNFTMIAGPDASPAKVLEQVNDTICKNNKEDMFVTVWLGIITLSTGRCVAANAGHEFPMLRKAGGQFELFEEPHGFVIGGMEGMSYVEYEFTLEKGGTLFLYTDGVPEATNAKNELYEMSRALAALNQDAGASPKELLQNVKADIDRFNGDAPQFDDLTMLAIKLL